MAGRRQRGGRRHAAATAAGSTSRSSTPARRRAGCATGEIAAGRRASGPRPGSRSSTASIRAAPTRSRRAGWSTTRCSATPGRRDPVATRDETAIAQRRPLRRLAGAGAARHAAPQRRDVGDRLQHRQRAPAQAAEAAGRDARCAAATTCSRSGSPACCSFRCRCWCCSRSRASPSASTSRARCSRCWRWRCSAPGRSPGLGLLCASRAQNSETANGLINLVTLPMMVLSGVFFSSSRFPAVLQPRFACSRSAPSTRRCATSSTTAPRSSRRASRSRCSPSGRSSPPVLAVRLFRWT